MVQNMNKPQRIVDVLGIGFGPANLSLAIANDEANTPLDMFFLEAASVPGWQCEMLLPGSDIQNNPLRDLVTPRNPQSYFTFTNYLKCNGRLFEFLNLGLYYPLRRDYAKYIEWAAGFFNDIVAYSTAASNIAYDSDLGYWVVETPKGKFLGRALVFGTGRSINVPELAQNSLGPRVFHLTQYLSRVKALDAPDRIAVLGASQSAVEINIDLMRRFPSAEIHMIHRSFSFRQKDTSPFSEYVYFPEFVDYFQNAGEAGRASLLQQLRGTNYSAADKDVFEQLIFSVYEEKLEGKKRVHFHSNTVVDHLGVQSDCVSIDLRESYLGTIERLSVDAIVLATGFKDLGVGPGKELYPKLLSTVADQLERRSDGALHVRRDYSVAHDQGALLFLNGICESSHGLGDAGSFSLLSLRSAEITKSLREALAKLRGSGTTPSIAM